jgi:DNA polymerase I-like protein with 3'-5' exonuclease and polymerase domains
MTSFVLPNIRKIFIPDKGYMMFDADLAGADGQVVAWEADDKEMKADLAAGVDMHRKNALEIGEEKQILSMDKSTYAYKQVRQSYKHSVHGTHYGASPHALVRHPAIGWPLAKATRFQQRYFERHPGIRDWHLRTKHELETKRTATNRFGYRIIYFDRVDGLLPEALAWVPQSTIALVCFKGALRLRKELPWVEILLQVHDSLVFQVPLHRADDIALLRRTLSVTIPYPDPLTIPWGLARSEKSWGDCEKIEET